MTLGKDLFAESQALGKEMHSAKKIFTLGKNALL
jgi:hypothetical protein